MKILIFTASLIVISGCSSQFHHEDAFDIEKMIEELQSSPEVEKIVDFTLDLNQQTEGISVEYRLEGYSMDSELSAIDIEKFDNFAYQLGFDGYQDLDRHISEKMLVPLNTITRRLHESPIISEEYEAIFLKIFEPVILNRNSIKVTRTKGIFAYAACMANVIYQHYDNMEYCATEHTMEANDIACVTMANRVFAQNSAACAQY